MWRLIFCFLVAFSIPSTHRVKLSASWLYWPWLTRRIVLLGWPEKSLWGCRSQSEWTADESWNIWSFLQLYNCFCKDCTKTTMSVFKPSFYSTEPLIFIVRVKIIQQFESFLSYSSRITPVETYPCFREHLAYTLSKGILRCDPIRFVCGQSNWLTVWLIFGDMLTTIRRIGYNM